MNEFCISVEMSIEVPKREKLSLNLVEHGCCSLEISIHSINQEKFLTRSIIFASLDQGSA